MMLLIAGCITVEQVLSGNEEKIILAAPAAFAILASLVLYVCQRGRLDENGKGIP